jgi:hypothetical protein
MASGLPKSLGKPASMRITAEGGAAILVHPAADPTCAYSLTAER